jgi:general secretion pathway protein A
LQTEQVLIGASTRGEAILWLRQQLALVDGISDVADSTVFDDALRQRVKNFQRNNGLQADGVVGARTMILLNSLAPVTGTPFLRPATATMGER